MGCEQVSRQILHKIHSTTERHGSIGELEVLIPLFMLTNNIVYLISQERE